jgi:hypothetical protein
MRPVIRDVSPRHHLPLDTHHLSLCGFGKIIFGRCLTARVVDTLIAGVILKGVFKNLISTYFLTKNIITNTNVVN